VERTLAHESSVSCVSWHPSNDELLSVDDNGIYLWNANARYTVWCDGCRTVHARGRLHSRTRGLSSGFPTVRRLRVPTSTKAYTSTHDTLCIVTLCRTSMASRCARDWLTRRTRPSMDYPSSMTRSCSLSGRTTTATCTRFACTPLTRMSSSVNGTLLRCGMMGVGVASEMASGRWDLYCTRTSTSSLVPPRAYRLSYIVSGVAIRGHVEH
jgi:WD40 repeat protein